MTPGTQDLLRGIIDTQAAPGIINVQQVASDLAVTPFSNTIRTLDEWCGTIGFTAFLGQPHPNASGVLLAADSRLTSLDWHALKHTNDRGWPTGTTSTDYLQSLQHDISQASVVVVGMCEGKPHAHTRADGRGAPPAKPITVAMFRIDRNYIKTAFRTSRLKSETRTSTWTDTITMRAA